MAIFLGLIRQLILGIWAALFMASLRWLMLIGIKQEKPIKETPHAR